MLCLCDTKKSLVYTVAFYSNNPLNKRHGVTADDGKQTVLPLSTRGNLAALDDSK